MTAIIQRFLTVGLTLATFSVATCSVHAQVVPDNTLGTQVIPTGTTLTINNGTRSGNNLFHSFSQFSVPTHGSAIFNNATDIQNIFSRVTGSQVSNIDGILKTQGGANLFLMNPNGILFGPNAKLELGGSFLGTTGNAIKFADGIEFNTVNATPALLSVNVPIGLQMGTNPGAITVQGTGHRITASALYTPLSWNGTTSGLAVNPGNTLALVGRDLNLTGGILSAPGGRVELGAVKGNVSSPVNLQTIGSELRFDYAGITQFGNIQLSQKALINASGPGQGSMQLQSRNLLLQDGSALILENRGNQAAGTLQIRATDSIVLTGKVPNGSFTSGIISDVKGSGNGADILLSTAHLSGQNYSLLTSRTFGLGHGGKMQIDAAKMNFIAAAVGQVNTIATRTSGRGQSGALTINTQQLRMEGIGAIGSYLDGGTGNGGDLTLNARDSIEMMGAVDNIPASLVIGASSIGGTGHSGNLTINTATLTLRNGARVNSSTYGPGDASSVTIRASESINVIGQRRDAFVGRDPSAINSAGILLPAVARTAFKLPEKVTGNTGNIFLYTPQLTVSQGAQISVRHDDVGNAGRIEIHANVVHLNQNGRLTATTVLGEGGDVRIYSDALLLRGGSRVITTAGGTGNGGNITIDSPIIVGLENSDIIANAVKGRGGSIKITTQSLLGLKYRDRLTAENDITASSEFGINGNVQVNTIGINPANALNALPIDLVDSSRQIADRCGNVKGGSLVATGRGGIPRSPIQIRRTDRPWNDLRLNSLQASAIVPPIIAQPIAETRDQPIVEASAIEVDETGAIVLVSPQSVKPNPSTCAQSMTTP